MRLGAFAPIPESLFALHLASNRAFVARSALVRAPGLESSMRDRIPSCSSISFMDVQVLPCKHENPSVSDRVEFCLNIRGDEIA